MQAEKAPFVGIVLALVIVAVETVGLIAYASAPAKAPASSVSAPPTVDHVEYKRIKVRCRR